MKIIPLTKGLFAKVSDEDFEEISRYNWIANGSSKSKSYYAKRRIGEKIVTMHREILGVHDPKIEIDHINHDTLDNQRHNLRVCTHKQNMGNYRKPITNTSGYKGVVWESEKRLWIAQIVINGKQTKIGRFKTKEDAAVAYNRKALEIFGEFALLNDIKEMYV